MKFSDPLPIDEALPELIATLAQQSCAVLVAPPGAGKTTRVPLALIDQDWAAGKRIIVLEPRRLAARAAAERMASTLGEEVGGLVGLRIRLQSRVSARTRIEIVTEGVFARMILDDPELNGIAAVIFDEFHERSLDADFGLALALDAQSGLRDDLRILVMSATLDGSRVASLMNNARIIESLGRAYPVDTFYRSRDPQARLESEVTNCILSAIHNDTGSILVFLPGQGEIRRTATFLEEHIKDPDIEIAPLYGAMDRGAQDRAVSPTKTGKRKIVLATSIAETSLTIEGVRVVIDCGLARVARYEPDLGLTRLETVRVSRAAADQRRGRAGRTEPGICYRLWEEAANGALDAYATPEILSADMSGLLLDLAAWGVNEPASLRWLDAPPAPAVTEARALLQQLEALDSQGHITAHGQAIRALALPPRLARMVVVGALEGHAQLAAEIAAVSVERGLGGDGVDVAERIERWRRDRSPRAQDARQLARGWARTALGSSKDTDTPSHDLSDVGALLARAFPDRIAKARGKRGEFLMANGRAASVEPHDRLAGEPLLAIAEITGRAGAARIMAACAISLTDVEHLAGDALKPFDDVSFDRTSASLRARRIRRLGALILAEQNLPVPTSPESAHKLAEGLAGLALSRLPWSKALEQWRGRVIFLRKAEGDVWPDLSDEALKASMTDWLAPFLEGMSGLSDLKADTLSEALHALLPWDLARKLESEAPTHFEAPTGNRFSVDYEAESGPTISVRVQELYGLSVHPALAGGRVPLTLELLSPAHRPIQITRDLPGFWRGSWADVKSDMKGRYPRHVWPDDPAQTQATARAKPRGT